jgi:hypothetical protein
VDECRVGAVLCCTFERYWEAYTIIHPWTWLGPTPLDWIGFAPSRRNCNLFGVVCVLIFWLVLVLGDELLQALLVRIS